MAWLWCRSHRKSVNSRPGFALRRLVTLSVNVAVNMYLFRIWEGQGSEWREMGAAFHLLCPRYNGLYPALPPWSFGYGNLYLYFLPKFQIHIYGTLVLFSMLHFENLQNQHVRQEFYLVILLYHFQQESISASEGSKLRETG